MHGEKHAAISQYLSANFAGIGIEHKPDFDRDAQSFKVHLQNGTLLLKVGNEFIGDSDTAEILRLFESWDLKEVMTSEKERGILITRQ